MDVNRRTLLRKLGLSSIALAVLPRLVDTTAKPADAQRGVNYHFFSVSIAGPQGAQRSGTPESPQHWFVMSGDGSFDPGRSGSKMSGGGFFVHHLFPGAMPPAGGTQLPIVASGTWGNGRLIRYSPGRTFGVQGTGVVEMVVDIFRQIPTRDVIRGARLKVVCVAGAAGFSIPGELEGFTLSVPNTEFSAGGNPGPFTPVGAFPTPRGSGQPASPGIGATAFRAYRGRGATTVE